MKTVNLKPTAAQIDVATNILNLNRRLRWEFSGGRETRVIADQNAVSTKKNGRWKTLVHADHRATVENYVEVLPRSIRHVGLNTKGETERRKAVKAPEGHRFDVDDLGLKLVRVSDGADYHFSVPEFLSGRYAGVSEDYRALVVQTLVHNAQRRAEREAETARQAKHDALFQKDIPTTRVSLADSRRVGNCVEGSLALAKLAGISREDALTLGFYVPAPLVLRAARGTQYESRAMAAVRAAWERETLTCI